MTLVGIAFLPDRAVAERVVTFGHRWHHELGEPRPGTDSNLPHVTLHQVTVRLVERFVDTFVALGPRELGGSEVGDLVYQPVGWIFTEVQRAPWMLSLQASAVEAVDPIVDRTVHKPVEVVNSYTAPERASYVRHGYRYVGEAFRPHVTIGRTGAAPHDDGRPPLSDACLADHRATLAGRPVRFERLVAYRAGPHGSLAEILAELPTATAPP